MLCEKINMTGPQSSWVVMPQTIQGRKGERGTSVNINISYKAARKPYGGTLSYCFIRCKQSLLTILWQLFHVFLNRGMALAILVVNQNILYHEKVLYYQNNGQGFCHAVIFSFCNTKIIFPIRHRYQCVNIACPSRTTNLCAALLPWRRVYMDARLLELRRRGIFLGTRRMGNGPAGRLFVDTELLGF